MSRSDVGAIQVRSWFKNTNLKPPSSWICASIYHRLWFFQQLVMQAKTANNTIKMSWNCLIESHEFPLNHTIFTSCESTWRNIATIFSALKIFVNANLAMVLSRWHRMAKHLRPFSYFVDILGLTHGSLVCWVFVSSDLIILHVYNATVIRH